MIDYSGLPERLQDGMKRYIENGIQPGDFLTACIQDKLVESLGRASTRTYEYVHSVAMFLYNEAPYDAWGSKEIMNLWIQRIGR